MADPNPTGEHEHDRSHDERTRAERGDTAAANQVLGNVLSARQTMEGMGQPFTEVVLREVLRLSRFAELSEKERAHAQKRLREELKIEVPDDLKVDESVLPALAAQPGRRAVEAPPDPEAARLELIGLAVEEVQRQFGRAQADSAAFSVEAVLKDFIDTLGDEGLRTVRERLAAEGVTDLVEGGAAPAGNVVGKPPALEARAGKGRFDARTVKFSYDASSDEFLEEFEEEFGDGHREARKRSLTLLELPGNAKRVAEDPAKLGQLLERMQEIYRAAAVVPLYIRKDHSGTTVELHAEFKYARPKERVEISLGEVDEKMLEIMEQDDNYSRSGAYQAYARPIQQRLRREYMARKGEEAVRKLLGEPARAADAGGAGGPADRGRGPGAGPGERRKVPRPQEVGLDAEAQVRLQAALERRLFEAYRAELAEQAGDRALSDVLEQEARTLVQVNLNRAFEDALVALEARRR